MKLPNILKYSLQSQRKVESDPDPHQNVMAFIFLLTPNHQISSYLARKLDKHIQK